MENRKPPLKALLAVISIIGIAVVWFAGIQEYTLQTGVDVYLETVPVDPRDPLRWDYVVLRYAIERDDKVLDFISKNSFTQIGDTVYIGIKTENEMTMVDSVSRGKPKNWLFIRWKIDTWGWVDLWIWKYFVPEGTGREIERVRSDMQVLAVVDKYGTAKIKDLYYQWEKINPDTFTAK